METTTATDAEMFPDTVDEFEEEWGDEPTRLEVVPLVDRDTGELKFEPKYKRNK